MSDAPAMRFATPDEAIGGGETRLVEVVDRLLDKGVVIRGEIWLTVAGIDLVFVGADLVLASPDRMGGAAGHRSAPASPRGDGA